MPLHLQIAFLTGKEERSGKNLFLFVSIHCVLWATTKELDAKSEHLTQSAQRKSPGVFMSEIIQGAKKVPDIQRLSVRVGTKKTPQLLVFTYFSQKQADVIYSLRTFLHEPVTGKNWLGCLKNVTLKIAEDKILPKQIVVFCTCFIWLSECVTKRSAMQKSVCS